MKGGRVTVNTAPLLLPSNNWLSLMPTRDGLTYERIERELLCLGRNGPSNSGVTCL